MENYNYKEHIDSLLKKTEKLVSCKESSNLKYLLGELYNENLKLKFDFFSFDYLRVFFKLSDISWVCLLISVLNEVSSYNFDPINETIRVCLGKVDKCKFYEEKEKLERESFLLFLDKNKKIDIHIFEFLMSNGNAPCSSREFEIFFPPENFKIEREKEALNLSNLCKSEKNSYIFIRSEMGMGKKFLVRKISFICDKTLILVDIEKCLNSEKDFSQIILSSLRESYLLDGFICFDKIDLIIDQKRQMEFIFKMVKRMCKTSFFLSKEKIDFNFCEFKENSNVLSYEMSILDNEHLNNIWEEKINDKDIKKIINFSEVSNVFKFTPKQIDHASNFIKSYKSMETKITKKGILNEIRKVTKAQFKGSAYIVKTKKTWDDLIIDKNDKNMIIDICTQRKLSNIVFETWGLGERIEYGKGLSILFSGAPGTGKTMAAGIIANELGLDLYRVDLSEIVSKYIGETEKNISSLFREAEKSNSILLFDEMDALFSQRTSVKDSHDRGANIEISYLLQKMEEHSGICILTTNYIENIDKAFFRRISYVFHFPKPKIDDRKKIWKNIFGTVPLDDEVDFDFLSKFDISGGSIKNIVVSSCFKGAQENKKVSMKHIVKSIEYELKKQGYTPLKSEFGEYSYLL